MKSLDFIKEAKTEVIGFRKWVKDGQPVWQIIRPDGNVEVRPRGFLEQRPPDITFVAWNNKFICPPDFSCSPQADNSPAPTVDTPVATKPPAPTVDVSGSAPSPVPMSKAHIDIAAKSQGAGNKPSSSSAGGTGGSVVTPAAKPYKGSAAAQAIQKLNPQVRDINKIFVGQELQLPDGSRYKVASGDTLDGIAAGRGRGTVTGTATKLPPNRQVDFADVQKKTDNKLLESRSPAEHMFELKKLFEAGPKVEPVIDPIQPPKSTAAPPDPQVWRGRGLPPQSAEAQIKNKWYKDTAALRNRLNAGQIDLNTYNKELAKLDSAAETAIKNLQAGSMPGGANATAQGGIKKGVSSVSGQPFQTREKPAVTPTPQTPTGSSTYEKNLYKSVAAQTPHPEPHVSLTDLDNDPRIKIDPETAKRVQQQREKLKITNAKNAKNALTLLQKLDKTGTRVAYISTIILTCLYIAQLLGYSFDLSKKIEEYLPPEERSEEDLQKKMTDLWERNVKPYMNDPDAFRQLPPQRQSELITITKQWLEVIQDPERAASLPPHLKPQIQY